MMENQQLRRADFITSIILLLFSLWILGQALQMPMKDTFGGVTNVWYVSPALLPLFISVGLFALGVTLLVHSVKTGGAAYFFERLKVRGQGFPESFVRFGSILLAFLTLVYLDIPRIDFFLCILLFMLFFVSAFYYDDDHILHSLSLFYLAGQGIILVLFVTGIAAALQSAFKYSMDVVALLFFLVMLFYLRKMTRKREDYQKKWLIALIVTIVTPAVIAPVFRYLLLVPLPKEGGIIELLNLIYYTIR